MKIIPAHPRDAADIARIWHAGWHQAHASIVPAVLTASRTPQEFSTRTHAHLGQTRLAWLDGEIVGFFMLDHDELYQFYVSASVQGKGVAAGLMHAAEAALGPGGKWLACTVGNARAARFYEKCGWARAATTPYEVETRAGPQVVNVWRYEKDLFQTD